VGEVAVGLQGTPWVSLVVVVMSREEVFWEEGVVAVLEAGVEVGVVEDVVVGVVVGGVVPVHPHQAVVGIEGVAAWAVRVVEVPRPAARVVSVARVVAVPGPAAQVVSVVGVVEVPGTAAWVVSVVGVMEVPGTVRWEVVQSLPQLEPRMSLLRATMKKQK